MMLRRHRRASPAAVARLFLEALEPRCLLSTAIGFAQPVYYYDHNAPG
jgi:hypothetical protein